MKKICLILLILLTPKAWSADHNAELLQQRTIVRFDGTKVTKTYSYDIQINNKNGDRFAEISIPYSKIYKVSKISASLHDRFGREIRKVKRSEMVDRSAISSISFYEDDFVKEFTVRHNVYPYRLKYSYTVESKQYMILASWNPVLWYDVPTHSASLEVYVPDSVEIRDYILNASKPEISVESGTKKYVWETSFDGLLQMEEYSPPISMLIPSVRVFPKYFYFDKAGSNETWVTYGNWILDINEGLNILQDNEIERIHREVTGVDNNYEKVKKLYQLLQDETRYINISIETGGMKPYPASYVAEKKYGDCKALTNYFKSVLDVAGINSNYTLVSSGDLIENINMKYPGPQFDHAILMVPIDGDTLWLDCTSKGPFDLAGTFIQNRNALIIKKDSSHFAHIPALDMHNLQNERKAHFVPDNSGKVEAHFHTRFRGPDFDEVYFYYSQAGANFMEYVLRNYFIQEQFSPHSHIIKYCHRDSASIDLDVDGTSATIMKDYGNESIFDVIPLEIPHLEKPGFRIMPVQMSYPIVLRDSFIIEIPEGREVAFIPESVQMESSYGKYCSEFKQGKTAIIIEKSFLLNSNYIETEEYAEFYEFLRRCLSIEFSNKIVFSKI